VERWVGTGWVGVVAWQAPVAQAEACAGCGVGGRVQEIPQRSSSPEGG